MRKLVVGLLGAAALAFGTAAQAEISIEGGTTVDVITPIDEEGNGVSFAFAYGETGPFGPNPFTEVLQFENTLAGHYVFDLSSSGTGANNLDILSVLLEGPGGFSQAFTPDINMSSAQFFLDELTLGAGLYTLTITGNSAANGSFSGNVSFNAVPEPATWAMMLLGFGAVGFAMRRRRQPALMQVA